MRAYASELRIKRVQNVAGYVFAAFLAVLLVMVLSGDRFQNFLSLIGLQGIYNPEKGVYADCSRPENKDVGYCIQKAPPIERDWKVIKGGSTYPVFDLSGK
jgi:hypothetical protein